MDQKSNINVTVENYFAMWNARDARTRRTLVEQVWTEQARPARPAPDDGQGTVRGRAARAAIFALFPYPRRLRAMTRPLRAAQRTGLDRRLARSSLPGRLSPVLGAAMRLGAFGAGGQAPPA